MYLAGDGPQGWRAGCRPCGNRRAKGTVGFNDLLGGPPFGSGRRFQPMDLELIRSGIDDESSSLT